MSFRKCRYRINRFISERRLPTDLKRYRRQRPHPHRRLQGPPQPDRPRLPRRPGLPHHRRQRRRGRRRLEPGLQRRRALHLRQTRRPELQRPDHRSAVAEPDGRGLRPDLEPPEAGRLIPATQEPRRQGGASCALNEAGTGHRARFRLAGRTTGNGGLLSSSKGAMALRRPQGLRHLQFCLRAGSLRFNKIGSSARRLRRSLRAP